MANGVMRTILWGSLLLAGGLRPASAAEVTLAGPPGANAPRQPQVAIGADRTVHVVYGVGDAVYYSRSTDLGETFSPGSKAFECRNLSLGMRRGPRIVVSDAAVIVSTIGGEQGKGQDGDLQSWTLSQDGTWSGPVRVNDVSAAAREGLHGMAAGAGANGSIWAVWLDLRNKRTEVYAARSTDRGASWGANRLVYRSPEKSVCECCHPSAAVDSHGRLHVLFRNSLGGKRDMYVVSTRDETGETFGEALPLSNESWKLNACPMDGGMLVAGPQQTGWAVYRQQNRVFQSAFGLAAPRSASPSQETLLGPGEQPVVAATSEGPLALWTAKRVGTLMLRRPGSERAEPLAEDARDPVVASDPAGRIVVAAWEHVAKDAGSVRVRRLLPITP